MNFDPLNDGISSVELMTHMGDDLGVQLLRCCREVRSEEGQEGVQMSINVLMLSSDSCGPCKLVKPSLIEVCDKLGLQLSIQTVAGPTDSLVLKYAVRAVPTVLLRDGDAVLKRFTGAKTKEQIEEFLKETPL